jgi:hypothetical protein
MLTTRTARLLSLTCLLAFGCLTLGCKEERLPPREQTVHAPQTKFIEPPHIDDANLVIARCGHPRSDAVLPIYDKLNNGPVRRMVFRGTRTLTFDFIPSHPIPKITTATAPFPHPQKLPTTLPPDSVWRFDEARLGKQEMLTTNRVKLYLPCAAEALVKEY